MKLLIIEDEIDLQKTIEDFFKLQNFNVHIASNKFEAEDLILVNQFDILLLDIGLPDGNGIDLLSVIKKNQQDCGILIISAKNSIDDKIKGLDIIVCTNAKNDEEALELLKGFNMPFQEKIN